MKTENEVLDQILARAVGKQIAESEAFGIVEANHFSNLQFSNLYEMIIMQGYEIVPDQEIVPPAAEETSENNTLVQSDPFEGVIREFNRLELSAKYKCLIRLAMNIAAEDEQTQKMIAEKFVQQVLDMRLQYSYIAVFLKAFFAHCNALGKAKLFNMIEYAGQFYRNRQQAGLVAEKPDSILSKPEFDAKDVKQIALFNPLKRSFVEGYFSYNKQENIISINEALWDSLSNYDKTEILNACEKKLEDYYTKLIG